MQNNRNLGGARVRSQAILHSTFYILHSKRSRSSKYQSGRLRTAGLQVRVLPGVPFRRVSPTTRGAPLRTERLGVELPHAAPIWPTILLEQYRTDGMDGACAFCN